MRHPWRHCRWHSQGVGVGPQLIDRLQERSHIKWFLQIGIGARLQPLMLLEPARVVCSEDQGDVAELFVFLQSPADDVAALPYHQLHGEKDDVGTDVPQELDGSPAIGHLDHLVTCAFETSAQLCGKRDIAIDENDLLGHESLA